MDVLHHWQLFSILYQYKIHMESFQVSAHVHRDEGFHDHAITFLMVAWGQFTDHDITLTAEIDEVLEEDLNCCRGLMQHFCIQRFSLVFIFRSKRDSPDVFPNRG